MPLTGGRREFLVANSKFHAAEMICDLRLETRNATLPRKIGFTGVEEAEEKRDPKF